MKPAAAASESIAEEAALRILTASGAAGDALVAGFLAASAARPGALFGPLQILIAGPGVGSRAFDGRPRQPGLGSPRPRGFIKGQPIPEAARVATPASLGALALLHAHAGVLPFERLADAGVEHARAIGAKERADALANVGRLGASALSEPRLARPILAVSDRAEGGLLSERDLADVRPDMAAPRDVPLAANRRVLLVPWALPETAHRIAETLAVVDARGVLGVLAYCPDDEGLRVPELGLSLPRDAVLVRRGIPRMSPGEPLPCPCAVALGVLDERPFLAMGARSSTNLSAAGLLPAWGEPVASAFALLAAARVAAQSAYAVAVVRSHESDEAAKLVSSERTGS